MYIETAVKDLKQGDLVDLEGDRFADPDNKLASLSDTLQEVKSLETKSPDCIVVHFWDFPCTLLPEHRVRVQRA